MVQIVGWQYDAWLIMWLNKCSMYRCGNITIVFFKYISGIATVSSQSQNVERKKEHWYFKKRHHTQLRKWELEGLQPWNTIAGIKQSIDTTDELGEWIEQKYIILYISLLIEVIQFVFFMANFVVNVGLDEKSYQMIYVYFLSLTRL